MIPANLPKLFTAQEAAAMLGIAPHTLAVWRCQKRQALPYVKIGGRVRYRVADLEGFIQENRHQISSAA